MSPLLILYFLNPQGALTENGIIAITNVTGLATLRRSALLGAHVCGKASSAAKTIYMDDGTSRTTIAAVTHSFDYAEDLNLGEQTEILSMCTEDFLSAVSNLRSLINEGICDLCACFARNVSTI